MPQVGGRDDIKLTMAAKSDDVIAGTAESGQYPEEAECGAQTHVRPCLRTNAELTQTGELMEAVCERSNLMLAYQRVMRNKGAAGVDAIPVSAFKTYLKQHWPMIKARLLAGDYIPMPVRRVEIPKPDGGVRGTRYPNGNGSADPTGDPSGTESAIRTDVSYVELWISSGSKCSSSD